MNTVKRGDTNLITLTVKDSAGVAVNLSGSTVRLLAVPISGGGATVLSASLGAGTGTVEHLLTGTLAVGTYSLEVEVTQGGVVTTAPSEGYATLIVTPDLG